MRKEKPPILHSVREVQTISGVNSLKIAPDETPFHTVSHIQEELQELTEALQTGDRKHIASEVSDVIILAMKIYDVVGVDAEEALSAKINRNFHKYTSHMEELIRSGLSYSEARKKCKELWPPHMDEEYEID